MKTKLFKTACCCLLLLVTATAYCQSMENGEGRMENGKKPFSVPHSPFPAHEVSMYATFGSVALDSKAVGALRPAAMTAGVGADYAWFFARHWGIGAGVEAAFPNVYLSSGNIAPSLNASSSLHRYTTRLYATYLRVPLWLRFRAPVWRHWFHVAAGASLDLALAGHYHTETSVRTGNSIQTAATTGLLSFGHGVSLIAETGLRWTLDSEWGIYTGAYAAYGMSDIRPANPDALRNVERLNLLQVGVKVKIMIH